MAALFLPGARAAFWCIIPRLMDVEKLKVFLSWSGERSRAVAQALHDLLPDLLQMVQPWLSVDDIEKGSKWQQVIAGQLEKCSYAILCLTSENLTSPWLLFEAGALSKSAESRVCTYLFDLEPSDVKAPLAQFQHSRDVREDTLKLVQTINLKLGAAAVEPARLAKNFDIFWPGFDARLRAIPPAAGEPKPSRERESEMVAEILDRVREQNKLLVRFEGYAEPLYAAILLGSRAKEDEFLSATRATFDRVLKGDSFEDASHRRRAYDAMVDALLKRSSSIPPEKKPSAPAAPTSPDRTADSKQ